MCPSSDLFLGLLAILFPPIAVWIKTGICSLPSLLNLLLLILGYLPGLLHAWYIIASMPDESSAAYYYYEEITPADAEAARAGRSRYEPLPRDQQHIPSGVGGANGPPQGYVAPPPQLGPRGYGTADGQQYQPQEERQGEVVEPSSSVEHQYQQDGAPPSYDQAIRGDNKVQK